MTEIKVPELAESVTEASIAEWHVEVGDAVTEGQVLATIETDKVVLEVPAIKAGTVAEIVKAVGASVAGEELIARLGPPAQASVTQHQPSQPAAASAAAQPHQSNDEHAMITEIKVPELAESVSEASLGEWLKQPGDYVAEGEVIANVETDKVVMEVPATSAGSISSLEVAVGASLQSGQVIAILNSAPAPAARPAAAPAASAPSATPAAAPIASPAARKMAAEQNIDLATITGSGKGGRIMVENVQTSPAAPVPPPQASAPSAGDRSESRTKLSRLRARIATRLLESQHTTASLSTFNEVDMSAIISLRKAHREEFEQVHGVRLGFMSFFVKAACTALVKYPLVNSSLDGDELVQYSYCDIGIAVGSPRGLVVPVLRNAEATNMAAIERAIADFGVRAKKGSIDITELTGGTFTITNGGVFGSMLSTPIINPPQSAILGIHATKQRAVVTDDGSIVARPMNYLALSYDHRVIDGRDAVLFLVAIKDAIENPGKLLLDL